MTSVLYMWSRRREDLIAKHNFFVSEGKRRLTDQFSNSEQLEKDADKFAESWLERMNQHFDPDHHDPDAFYEQAYEERHYFYLELEELGNVARLSLVAGMFHMWEKALRGWIASNDGIGSFCNDDAIKGRIWKSNFSEMFDLFRAAGLFPDPCPIYESLNACRLVVNAYKHGEGGSLRDLKKKRPEFFDPSGLRLQSDFPDYIRFADHEDLFIKSKDIEEFSNAIVGFWRAIPEHITSEEFQFLPEWLQQSLDKSSRRAVNAN